MEVKKCSRCCQEKSLEEFSIDKKRKDGLMVYCKGCVKIRYLENKDKYKKTKKEYYENNRDNEFSGNLDDDRECFKCNEIKKVCDFSKDRSKKDGLMIYCKECETKRKQLYYQQNKHKINQKGKQYRIENKKNILEQQKRYQRKRREIDPPYRLKSLVSVVIKRTLKNNGCAGHAVWRHLPYTPQQLKEHLESQFEFWMTWENQGRISHEKRTWQIDHIIPQDALPYDSYNHPNFQKCWALENLRPLEAFENNKKSAKVEGCSD